MSYKLGITGSMGVGKTTIASIFNKKNIPVWNADEAVHKIYKNGGSGYKALTNKFPVLKSKTGIDRNQLMEMINNSEITIQSLENIIHPLLISERVKFISKNDFSKIIVFEIPLLFETNADSWLDGVLLVSCSRDTQMKRLKKRSNLTKEKIETLLSRQQKLTKEKSRSKFFIDTDKNFCHTEKEVFKIIKLIKDTLNEKRSCS